MPVYQYVAKNEHGENVKGKVEARTESLAAQVLAGRQLLVISIKPLGSESFAFLKRMFGGVRHDDLVNFTRQLSTMINAGLPLASALSILQEQTNPDMASLVGNVLKSIETGLSFSKALAQQSKYFSRVYIQLVKAGELGGVLDNVLQRLADTMEKEKEFRAKTKGAMIYPMIVLIAMVIVAFVMMIFVIPKLTEMYKDFGAELPLPTRILIGFSDFFVKFWWLLLAAIGVAFAGLRQWYGTPKGEKRIDAFLFKIPIYGKLRTKIILTDFSRTLALLLGAGVSLMDSLDIVGESMPSIMYREAVKASTKQIEKGLSLSQTISHKELFPPILSQMIAVGEETGKLDDTLLKLSVYFESESEHAVKNLTTAMEPVIMIVLGLGVGLMVVAIIMPIYNLTSQF